MTTREKIILGAALLAALVGVGSYIVPGAVGSVDSAEARRTRERAEVDSMAQAVRAALQAEKLDPVETKVLALLREKQDRDPFLRPESLVRLPEKGAEKEAVFEYSGFLSMGGKAFAIINGVEYQIGDELLDSGYVLKRASPEMAVIARKGDKREIILTFKE